MLATKQQLIDALLYKNLRTYYPGDLLQDAGEMLQTMEDRSKIKQDLCDLISGECLSQLPGEDFLVPIIDLLQDIQVKGTKKEKIAEQINHVIEQLEDLQQCQANASDYARVEFQKFIKGV